MNKSHTYSFVFMFAALFALVVIPAQVFAFPAGTVSIYDGYQCSGSDAGGGEYINADLEGTPGQVQTTLNSDLNDAANDAGDFTSYWPVTYDANPQIYCVNGHLINTQSEDPSTWSVDIKISNGTGIQLYNPPRMGRAQQNAAALYAVNPIPTLAASCSVNPPTQTTGQSVTWNANFSGGTPPYSYTWSGPSLSGTGIGATASQSATYSSTGIKNGYISVIDSGTGGNQQTISNQPCSNSATITPAPVVSDTLSASNIAPTSGSSITLTWTSQNASSPSSCSIDQGVGTVSPASGGTTNNIYPPNGSTTYTLTCQGNGGPAVQQVQVTVANPIDVFAYNPLNVSVTAGNSANLTATVGTTPTSAATGIPFWTTFWVNSTQSQAGATPYEFPSGVTSGFPANYSEPETYPGVPFPTAGPYYYQVCGDLNQLNQPTVPDVSLSNNCSGWATITVNPAAQPDLTAANPAPVTTTAGSSYPFTDTISNIGAAASPSTGFGNILQICDSGVVISGICTSYDNVINASYVNSSVAAGGGTTPVTQAMTVPSTAGPYDYRWCANEYVTSVNNFSPVVPESNYTNNCSAWTSLTTSAPVTAGITCSPTQPTGFVGQDVLWESYPTNFSPAPTYTWSLDGFGNKDSGLHASSFDSYYTSTGNYTTSVSATNGTQSASAICSVVTITTATVSLKALPTRVQKNQPGVVTLSWTNSGLTNPSDLCSLTGDDGLTMPNQSSSGSGVVDPNPLTGQTHYTITCNDVNDPGIPITSSATVNIVPIFVNF
jgi:hypothetical protein